MVSTGLTRARRSQAALALDPIPASKVHSDPLEIAELDKHNLKLVAYERNPKQLISPIM
jgi:hypothetical protein